VGAVSDNKILLKVREGVTNAMVVGQVEAGSRESALPCIRVL
jgi:hypothetical protein